MKKNSTILQANADSLNQGVRADILYGNILDQQRYFFVLPYIRQKTILDCACGIGWGSYVMSMSGAGKITAVDVSLNAISAACKYYSRPNIEYICADFLATSFDYEQVDIITSFETLEHIQNPEKYLSKLKEVCHEGTLLFLSSPNALAFKAGLARAPYNPFHVDEYSKEQVVTMFSKTGWNVVSYLGQHPMPINSDDIAHYKEFLRDYWHHFTRTRRSYFWRIYYLLLQKLLKREFRDPAHQGNCYPVPVTQNMEPAYHYFILKPIRD